MRTVTERYHQYTVLDYRGVDIVGYGRNLEPKMKEVGTYHLRPFP